ncbi:MAG TPA: SIS domain-containing protein [Thermoleophilia bacterium]|nr:SIS domain-containing protein [Thermoleophilia bacterium]
MSKTSREIASQPACWRRAIELAAEPITEAALPPDGALVAVVGCGTSWFMAHAWAAEREALGRGPTDAFAASEFPRDRVYPWVVAISRSGTTSEVLSLLESLPPQTESVCITGVAGSPCARAALRVVLLDFADEESVVQTRYATTTLVLLKAHIGADVSGAASAAEAALAAPLPLDPAAVEQLTFLGTGWTVGLASEAALKCREAAQLWTESYPAMEYRHGPIAIAAPGRAVWPFGPLPSGLDAQIEATGAVLADTAALDPLAALVLAQRFAVAVAEARGLDPDVPRSLSRSVILPPGQAGR